MAISRRLSKQNNAVKESTPSTSNNSIISHSRNTTINVDLNNRKLRKNTRQKPILDKSTKNKVDELYYNPRVRNNNYTQYSIHELINRSTNKPHMIKRNNLKPTKTPQTVTTNTISQSIQSKGKLVQINDINNNIATKKHFNSKI